MNIVWLSADPVVRGALGITDRIEGPRYFLRNDHEVLLITGGDAGAEPFSDIPTRVLRTRYIPFAAWLTLWPGVLSALRALRTVPDIIVSDFGLLPPAMRWAREVERSGRTAPKVLLDVRSHPVEAGRARLAVQRLRFALTLRRYGRSVIEYGTPISPELAQHVARLARIDPSSIPVWTSGCAWCDAEPAASARNPFPE